MSDLRMYVGPALMVTLYVAAPATVMLTAYETVRIDRQVHSEAGGVTVDRHGDLLRPGTTTVNLQQGTYHFRTMQDAQLYVTDPSSVRVVTAGTGNDKDPWPDMALQNRTASSHETPSTGNRSPCAVLGRLPVTRAYCA